MPIYLTYSEVRAFAKAVGKFSQQNIKHSEILEDIASSLGMKPDAMMHFLKTAEKERKALSPVEGMSAAEFVEKWKWDRNIREDHARRNAKRRSHTLSLEERCKAIADVEPEKGKLRIDGRFASSLASKVSKKSAGQWHPLTPHAVIGLLAKATGKTSEFLFQVMCDWEGIERPKMIVYDEFYIRGSDPRKVAEEIVKAVIPYSYMPEDALRAFGKSPDDPDVVHTGGGWFRVPRGNLLWRGDGDSSMIAGAEGSEESR